MCYSTIKQFFSNLQHNFFKLIGMRIWSVHRLHNTGMYEKRFQKLPLDSYKTTSLKLYLKFVNIGIRRLISKRCSHITIYQKITQARHSKCMSKSSPTCFLREFDLTFQHILTINLNRLQF